MGEIPGLTSESISEAFQTALKTPTGERTAEQRTLLHRWYRMLDPEWQKRNKVVQDHLARAPKPAMVKALISSEGLPVIRLLTQGADFLPKTYFHRRGDPNQKEGVAPLGYLQTLSSALGSDPWKVSAPEGSRLSYRCTSLANWLNDVEHDAGSLLARVIVNRLWQHHFGRGFIPTTSDFGVRREKPSHPDLLDYLAGELIRNGWQLKVIHKHIMMSLAYQQSSDRDPVKVRADQDNTLFWHFIPRRLEAEAIRDSMLAVTGAQDTKMFGPGILDEASKRRHIYFTANRSKLIPMMVIFDAPDSYVGIGERPSTTIAP